MADVKWIKIVTDIFDDEKILLIESMPDSDSIIVIWFKLLCLAGKNNNSGVFMLNDTIHYTDEMLATIFRKPLNTVRFALQTFEKFGMIVIINNVITIPNWDKHQNLDSIEKRRERQKEYMRERRAKQKQLTDKNSKANSKANGKANVSSLEGEREEEREGDKENISKDILCSTYVQRLIKKWNSIGLSSTLKTINAGTNRYKMLKARIRQYSEEEIINAIDEVQKSDFLMGRIKEFEITFDWFIKPNNFTKVLEGNYRNKGGKPNVQGANGVQSIEQDSGSIADKFKERQHRLTDEERRRAEEELD
ncbi:phage replisome organizer N-terminal domain-containing protein [Clostridium sp. LY3-2]|uniref:phage replisome organizer N-terminal domain-containing protein n=1 Tax=Clostridium sp. LY3-2 TaxID=2942482 RepID=UPI002152F4FA|nr:phage replisome organizer N-terminal domain-containing protein [Clostridium sp. LY3-2]MCR6516298.1 phage replisome organizer N-terminal domain-containing protein [Clostridium sp. LY3-2]